ncbi:hypothetical protein E0493_08580 [Roseomonas sp. M0104]|uniref:Uncharacterized protein n=1 Tax=Teichococcus coralli TaxID=2545983 RepID=A0A845B9G7_9PROT|nr:hypothetical protein [Pseudoroseomonas coralli]MXP63405.1 hypothetical protein [Pseudoroseomonas coralli]
MTPRTLPPLHAHTAETLALLNEARASGAHEMGDLIEGDLFAACRAIVTAASPALRRDLVKVLHDLAAPAVALPIPHNEQPPRG